MNKLEKEQEIQKKLYRELFLKANDFITSKMNGLKKKFSCLNQCSCCTLRYSDLSPSEIYQLARTGEQISQEFIELFVPFGAEEGFEYNFDCVVDIDSNHTAALAADGEYVGEILSKLGNEQYFYCCRNRGENNKCSLERKPLIGLCRNYPHSVTTIFPKKCVYRKWQEQAIEMLNADISRDVLLKLREINLGRENYTCQRTGTCCKIAGSEYSYEQLKERSANGDKFSQQFVSVFVPYKSLEDAREIFPEYVDTVLKKTRGDDVHFYYCPHLSADNLCTRYEERPDICKDFPSNPLAILPYQCGYHQWKEENEIAGMLLHAMIEIIEFTAEKIQKALA